MTMRQILMSCILVLALLPAATSAGKVKTKTITLTKEQLMDKIKGAWAGQTIGCTYGGPVEFVYRASIIPDSVKLKWNEHGIKGYFDIITGLYDDVYMDLTFVDVFEKYGLDAPVDSFAMAFARAPYNLWHANQAARYNIQTRKIMPPASGHWLNNPHADCIDFQIESDFAGIMSPAMPQAACGFADKIGHIMNYGDGYYGGVYVATMYALAFVYDDIETIVTEAVKSLPEQSNYRKCIEDVVRWYHENPTDWKRTWDLCETYHANDRGCPEGVEDALDIDASLNGAYVVMGLLYGQGDYSRTLEISTRCGQDADCNPSTAAGVLSAMIGYSNIPEYWVAPLREVEDRPFRYTDISVNRATEMSFNQALQVIQRNGGRVKGNKVKIKVQPPQPVPYEKSFENLRVDAVENFPQVICLAESPAILKFNGVGVVLRGWLKNAPRDYIGKVQVTIDGNAETMILPARYHDRAHENVYWNYQLPSGRHTMKIEWLNPVEGTDVEIHRAVYYTEDSTH